MRLLVTVLFVFSRGGFAKGIYIYIYTYIYIYMTLDQDHPPNLAWVLVVVSPKNHKVPSNTGLWDHGFIPASVMQRNPLFTLGVRLWEALFFKDAEVDSISHSPGLKHSSAFLCLPFLWKNTEADSIFPQPWAQT